MKKRKDDEVVYWDKREFVDLQPPDEDGTFFGPFFG